MIKKNIIGICLLVGLSVISCKKTESNSEKMKVDSSVTHQTAGNDTVVIKKPDAVKVDSAKEQYTGEKDSNDPVVKNAIEGKYVAKTCDGGKFSIDIKNVNGKPTFKILDKTKTIAAGNASVEGEGGATEGITITMGEIGGVYEGDKIVIQNSGNSMNEFEHFTQCGDKYLEFTKQK